MRSERGERNARFKETTNLIKVFEILTRAGLQCYLYRLYQFEDACRDSRMIQKTSFDEGIEIIDLVTYSPTNEN